MDAVAAKILLCLGVLALILLIFVALAIVCDDYLCLSLERICDSLQVPDDVAGASFLALGSAAPEVAINAMACTNMST
jgi:sodium/potassium/calcium exchanger 4